MEEEGPNRMLAGSAAGMGARNGANGSQLELSRQQNWALQPPGEYQKRTHPETSRDQRKPV